MIRSELDVLLDKVEDPALRADLRSQIDRLKQRAQLRACVRAAHPRARAAAAAPDPRRFPGRQPGRRRQPDLRGRPDRRMASPRSCRFATPTGPTSSAASTPRRRARGACLDSLVVISDFGEPVYPGFRRLGSVERGGDKPHHVVIKGENHHALEALRSPTPARSTASTSTRRTTAAPATGSTTTTTSTTTDAYRHSKWLAFMERRLKLAKELLNPDDSVLIVTIDEKEYLRLGLLLEQTFPERRLRWSAPSSTPQGTADRTSSRGQTSTSSSCMFGAGARSRRASRSAAEAVRGRGRWQPLRRTRYLLGTSDTRPSQFYPIYVDHASSRIVGTSESHCRTTRTGHSRTAERRMRRRSCPFDADGTEMNWGLTPRRRCERDREGIRHGSDAPARRASSRT